MVSYGDVDIGNNSNIVVEHTSVNPGTVQNFVALRGDSERRNAWLKWAVNPNATGYHIYFGNDPNKLYNSVMVYGVSEYYCNALEKNDAYYFQIEAFNENGIGPRSPVMKAD